MKGNHFYFLLDEQIHSAYNWSDVLIDKNRIGDYR